MTRYVLDTSALVKAYLPEAGTDRVRSVLIHSVGPNAAARVLASRLAYPEAVAAVTRAEAAGRLSAEEAEDAVEQLAKNFGGPKPVYEVFDVTRTLVDNAAALARRHRLRGFDAVHLATALAVRDYAPPPDEVEFMATDKELIAAARAEGLTLVELS